MIYNTCKNILEIKDLYDYFYMFADTTKTGLPKRIVYVKNTNLEILNKRLTDEGKEETKDYNEAKVLINEGNYD